MPDESKDRTDVIVTIANSHRATIATVVEQLGHAGLVGANTLAAAGLVTGSVVHDRLARLKAVPGVEAVEVSGSVQLPDSDAEVQ